LSPKNQKDDERGPLRLSKDEIERLILFSEGRNDQEIATKMCLSATEVVKRRTIVLGKLQIENRAQAIYCVSILGTNR
jgi:DNA-binding NarL/FixJ family response regulator